ncbi:MAG TPA: gas vesicle protein K [Terriglobales bacterium]|nr:gas vesicle protein K [Terriglobales bacterium]
MPEDKPHGTGNQSETGSPADSSGGASGRIECSPENIDQGLAKLVLSLIELLHQLLERQAIRRMEAGTLTDAQVEEMGEALMRLEAKINELAANFGLTPADLNLDLGPLGRLIE